MYHTIEISTKCSKGVFYTFFCKNNLPVPAKTTWSTKEYSRIGFNLIRLSVCFDRFNTAGYTKITIQLNPSKLLGRERMAIADGTETEDVYRAFHELLEQIYPDLPCSLEEYRLERIDYAYDLQLDRINTAVGNMPWLYIDLLKKGMIPNGYKSYTKADSSGLYYGRKSKTQGKNIAAINLYYKLPQIMGTFEQYPTEASSVYHRTKQMIRCEVQCSNGRLRNYSNAHKEKELKRELLYWAQPEIAQSTITSAVGKIEVDAPYTTLQGAERLIEASTAQRRTKDRRKELVTSISKGSTLETWKARNKPETFRREMQWFREAGVNPVTIPAKHKIDYLPSINSLLQEAIEQECKQSAPLATPLHA